MESGATLFFARETKKKTKENKMYIQRRKEEK